jgi:hypothetical protein
MSKKTAYRQCKLQKGNSHQMSWIPEKFAVLNKTLKLKGEGEDWDDGWVVKEVHSRREDDEMLDPHAAIKGHRKNTGDSLPKNN